MVYEIIAVIALFGSLNAVLTYLFSRSMVHGLNAGINHLDSSLAEALKVTLDGIELPEMEPINPFQAFLMDMMREKMNPGINVTEIRERDGDGKFIKDNL